MVIEINDGQMVVANWPDDVGLADVQEFVGGRVEGVEVLSADPELSLIGYCNADQSDLPSNCTVEGYGKAIRGPLLVMGTDEHGNYRPLDMSEAAQYEMYRHGPEFLPVFRRKQRG